MKNPNEWPEASKRALGLDEAAFQKAMERLPWTDGPKYAPGQLEKEIRFIHEFFERDRARRCAKEIK